NIRGSGWLHSQVRLPDNYVLLILLAIAAAVVLRGPEPIALGGHEIRIYPPYNLLTIAFAIWFVRFLFWWWQTGLAWNRELDPQAQQVVCWHAWPVLVGFLIPGHLKDFFVYLTRDHGHVAPHHPVLGGLPVYSECLRLDYHASGWSLAIVLVLLGLSLLTLR